MLLNESSELLVLDWRMHFILKFCRTDSSAEFHFQQNKLLIIFINFAIRVRYSNCKK